MKIYVKQNKRIMKKIYYLVPIAWLILTLLSGCSAITTRVEQDVFTITRRDTTDQYLVQNAPGNRDNGVIYPSSRRLISERNLLQQDSIVERKYPDFIRLGAFESIGFFIGGDKNYSAGYGLFGIFPNYDDIKITNQGNPDYKIKGGLYRLGIAEWRLRWFRDAPDWTVGTSMIEVISPDARFEKTLSSVFPLYLRKRFYLFEQIPYVALTTALGIGYWPSQYVNLSASLDLGSLGGFNLRAYAGFVAGTNPANSPQVQWRHDADSTFVISSQTSIIPYIGLGVSVLDFINLVPELYREWKDYSHSGWDIGFIQVAGIYTGAQYSVYSDVVDEEGNIKPNVQEQSDLVKGALLRVGNASLALPIDFLDNKLYIGSSLINLIAMGKQEWGLGVLPIRIGFLQTVIADELTTEPFFEYSYYPSSIVHFGNRLNLRISDFLNISFIIGYASGKTDNKFGNDILKNLGKPIDFARPYFGINIGLGDRIFFPEEIRYNR